MSRDDYAALYALSSLLGIILFGAVAYMMLEGWTFTEALYFTVYTVTTVGYGNLVPSPENRLFTAVFIMVCATMVLACIAAIGNWLVSTIQRRSAVRRVNQSRAIAHAAMSRMGEDALDEASEEFSEIEESIRRRIGRL